VLAKYYYVRSGYLEARLLDPALVRAIACQQGHEFRSFFQPMLPLALFSSRNFSYGNLATLAIYAGLSVSGFIN